LFESSVHLLLHRFGVMSYAPSAWRLLPNLMARAPSMTPKQLAVSSWSLGRTLVNDDEAWRTIGTCFRHRVGEYTLTDLAMMAWAFSVIGHSSPPEIVALKKAVRMLLVGQTIDDVSSHDLAMIFKAVSKLTPQDARFLEWLLLLMSEGIAEKTMAFAAQGLVTVWSVLASLSWKLSPNVLETLCEESRNLRLDHTFNQDMAVDLAHSLVKLGVSDPRPEYQVVDYVARRGLSLRADTLLELIQFMASRGVTHPVAWKRIGVRAQQRAVDLSLADIDRLASVFRKSGRGNDRIFGMLQLFMKIREDQSKYGAS